MITLRLARPSDCRLVWEWANEPDVRAASFSGDRIPWEEHERWFRQRLDDPTCRLFIVLDGDESIGQVRFESSGASEAEVHISISPERRGRGVAMEALRTGCARAAEQLRLGRIIAQIKCDNERSLRAFEKAGFVQWGRTVASGHAAERLVWSPHVPFNGQRVLFAADATPQSGLGHLSRCTALASALGELGGECLFLTEEMPSVAERVTGCGARVVVPTDESWDAQAIARTAEREGCAAVVVDSYRLEAAALRTLRDAGLITCAIDDFGGDRFACHLVVNGGFHGETLRYASSAGDTVFLLGPQFALLRPQFWNPPEPLVRDPVRDVVVVLGGSVPSAVLSGVLQTLADLPTDIAVTVIVGPFSPWSPADAGRAMPGRVVRTLRDPPQIADLMAAADLAVCAGGQTTYELAAIGTAAVAVQLASNQVETLRAMSARGAIRTAGVWGERGVEASLRALVHELMNRRDLREQQVRAARRYIDGQGARRTARTLHAMLARREPTIAPRVVTHLT